MKIIPFKVTIPDQEVVRDLAEQLIATEGPGMLACMIDSCVASAPPAVVTSAKEKYLEDENVFLAWGHLEKLLPMPIACGPGVNIHESEQERSGHLSAFCSVG